MTIIFIVLIAISLAFKYNLSLTTKVQILLQRRTPPQWPLTHVCSLCVCVHFWATWSMKTHSYLCKQTSSRAGERRGNSPSTPPDVRGKDARVICVRGLESSRRGEALFKVERSWESPYIWSQQHEKSRTEMRWDVGWDVQWKLMEKLMNLGAKHGERTKLVLCDQSKRGWLLFKTDKKWFISVK